MRLLCKIFGHKTVGLNPKRLYARCDRCNKGLKVSYDMFNGNTIVTGDYGNQRTFVWCNCGNELCSTESLVSDTYEYGVHYKCSSCGENQWYDFDSPVPYRIKDQVIETQNTKENTLSA